MSSNQKRDTTILVTGCHRSGTTWLASMLNFSSNMQIIDEPFNLGSWAYKLNNLADKWYYYIPRTNEDEARAAFQKVLNNETRFVYRRRSFRHWLRFARIGRHLVKDPIAALSSEWLSNNFHLDVVVIVRHPMAFVKSLRRMNWRFPFDDILRQKSLMEDHLNVFKDELLNHKAISFDEQAVLLWKCIYYVLHKYSVRNDNWIVVRHEDLSGSPIVEFESLYEKLSLNWNIEVERRISEYTQSNNPVNVKGKVTHQMKRNSKELVKDWQRVFKESEVQSLRMKVEEVAKHYYTDLDW